MKTKKAMTRNMILFAIGVCLSLLGCSGEDGTDGINGEQGPPGADGKDGNANVFASDWMPIVWSYTGDEYAEMEIPVGGILDFVESGGIVALYLRSDSNGTTVSALPVTYSSGVSYTFRYGEFAFGFQGIRLEVRHSSPQLLENNPDFHIRYVLIPTNVAEASGLADNMPESFGEAAALLGLE